MTSDDLEEARTLERALERLHAAILDDHVQLENCARELKRLAQREQDIARRIEERKAATERIRNNVLNLYRSATRNQ